MMMTDKLRRGVKNNLILFFLLGCILLAGCHMGRYRLGFSDVWDTLLGNGTATTRLLLFEFRLPRLCLALLVGIGMGISGVVMQDLLHNDLASPGTLGVSSGSGLFVTMAISLLPDFPGRSFLLPVFAMFGGLFSAGLIFLLTQKRRTRFKTANSVNRHVNTTRLILVGVAVSSCYGALSTFLTLLVNKEDLEFLQRWQAGELWGTKWNYIAVLTVWIIVFGFLIYRKAHVLNVIGLNFDLAISLGVSLKRQFMLFAFYAVAISSAAVAFGGNFFFLGLIGPHIARRLVGKDVRLLLPAAGMTSAFIVLAAEIAVGQFTFLANIPAGIIISLISVPYFLYLLIRS